MNLGNVTSMIRCSSCGFDIWIYPNQATTICEHCKTVINLNTINFNLEGDNDMKDSKNIVARYTGDVMTTKCDRECHQAYADGEIAEIDGRLLINTPEGTKIADKGDYIVKDDNGYFYPCKPNEIEKYNSTIDIEEINECFKYAVEARERFKNRKTVKNGTYRGEEIVDVRIVKLHKDAIIPTYAHDTDSGMDIFVMEDVIIQPHETVAIPTGIAIALPRCYELQLRPKSGNSLKTKLRIANAPSTIDEGYRGDIGVICDNIGDTPIEIKKGKAICQGVLRFVPKINWIEVDEFTDTTDRGTGAYGSSNRGI